MTTEVIEDIRIEEEWIEVTITSAEESQSAVDYILEQKEPVAIICCGEKHGDSDGKIAVLVISIQGKIWIYQLCNLGDNIMESGRLKQLFFDTDLMKVFHDVTWQSAILFKDYEIVLDGTRVFDSKVVCQMKLLDTEAMDSLRLEGFMPTRWDLENSKIDSSKWTQNPLDKDLSNKLVERCKAQLQFYRMFTTVKKLCQPKKEIYNAVNKYIDIKRAKEIKKQFKFQTKKHQGHSTSSSACQQINEPADSYAQRAERSGRERGDLRRRAFGHPGEERHGFQRSFSKLCDAYWQGPMEAFSKNIPGAESSKDHGVQAEEDIFLSKTLSFILRHGAEKLKFKLMPGGFLYVDEILKKMQKLEGFTEEDVKRIVAQNDKQSFALQKEEGTGRLKIRASQKHTVKGHGKKLVECNLGEHEVPVSHIYQMEREHPEALDYQYQLLAEDIRRKRKSKRETEEVIEKEAIPEIAVYEHEKKDFHPIYLGATPTELKLPSTLGELRDPAEELFLELAVGSADAEDENEPCNQDQGRRRMDTLSRLPATIFRDKMEEPTGPSPLQPVALEHASENNQLHLDPNNFFLGAPSTVMKSHAATVLQKVRRRALCHKDGRKVEFLSPDGAACVIKRERCVLPDGSIYELTSTWIPDPECKEQKEQPSQTVESISKTTETGIHT